MKHWIADKIGLLVGLMLFIPLWILGAMRNLISTRKPNERR